MVWMAVDSRMLIGTDAGPPRGWNHTYVKTFMQIASIVDHPALIITRNIEWWVQLLRKINAHVAKRHNSSCNLHFMTRRCQCCRGTVILGFEQCNKYTVMNEKGEACRVTL